MSAGDVGDRSAALDQVPWTLFSIHRRTMTASLYSSRSGTLSQWSWSWSSVDSSPSYLRGAGDVLSIKALNLDRSAKPHVLFEICESADSSSLSGLTIMQFHRSVSLTVSCTLNSCPMSRQHCNELQLAETRCA